MYVVLIIIICIIALLCIGLYISGQKDQFNLYSLKLKEANNKIKFSKTEFSEINRLYEILGESTNIKAYDPVNTEFLNSEVTDNHEYIKNMILVKDNIDLIVSENRRSIKDENFESIYTSYEKDYSELISTCRLFNDNATAYNKKLSTVSGKFVKIFGGYKPYTLYQIK